MTLALAATLTAGAANRVVENPRLGANNASNLDFPSIELTDTATLLHAKVTYRPNWWITISPESFIEAGGKRYYVTDARGIELGEKHVTPASGINEFTLVFDPIPSRTKSINFKEGENSGWRIYDIDLTGAKAHPLPAAVPAALKKPVSNNAKMPDMIFKADSTTVNVHITDYKPDMGSELSFVVNNINGQTGDLPPIKIDEKGNGSVKIFMPGTGKIIAYSMKDFSVSGNATLAPGETVDLYIDPAISGFRTMDSRKDSERISRPWSWHNGKYSEFDRARTQGSELWMKLPNLYSGSFVSYTSTGDDYTKYLTRLYLDGVKEINAAKNLPALTKEIYINELRACILYAATHFIDLKRRTYWSVHKNYGKPVPMDSLGSDLSADQLRAIAGLFDINDPHLLLASNSDSPTSVKWGKAGIKAPLHDETEFYITQYYMAASGKADKAAIDSMRTFSTPFYADAVEMLRKGVEATMASLDLSLCQPTPDVADDKLFEAIIAPHKGKVVMVDLWNTWCGPCRAALAQNEPLKKGELSSDDIVWIYIADESSPMVKYFQMIPDIKGIHYRLNDKQIAKIRSQFNVDGIPFYIFVDRQGNATGRPDLRDHNLFKKTILDAVKAK